MDKTNYTPKLLHTMCENYAKKLHQGLFKGAQRTAATQQLFDSCLQGLRLARERSYEGENLSGRVDCLSPRECLFASMGYAVRDVKIERLQDFGLYQNALREFNHTPEFLGLFRKLKDKTCIEFEDKKAFLKSLFLKKALELSSSPEEIIRCAEQNGIEIPELLSFLIKAQNEGVSKEEIVEAARTSGLTYEELRNLYTSDPKCRETLSRKLQQLQERYTDEMSRAENDVRKERLREIEVVEQELMATEDALNTAIARGDSDKVAKLERILESLTGTPPGNRGRYDEATDYVRFHVDCANERRNRNIDQIEREIKALAEPFEEAGLLRIPPPDPGYTADRVKRTFSGPRFRPLPTIFEKMIEALTLNHPDHFAKLCWELRQYDSPSELRHRERERMVETLFDRISSAFNRECTAETFPDFLDWYFSEGSDSDKGLLIETVLNLSSEIPERFRFPLPN